MRTLFAPAAPTRRWTVTASEVAPGGPAEAELTWVLACQHAADLTDRPGEPASSPAELRSLLVPPYRGRRMLFAATDVAGRSVGWARLGLYEAFHRDVAHAAITVHPSMRGCGVGSQLLEALARAARGQHRTRLILDAPRTAATEAFATRHGFVLSGRDLRSRLDLTAPALADRLAAVANRPAATQGAAMPGRPAGGVGPAPRTRRHARPRPDPAGDFAVLRWNGPCPEQFLASYVSTLDFLHAAAAPEPSRTPPGAASATAATAEVAIVTPFTRAEVRHRELAASRAGLREYTACLIDRSSGRIAALSSAHTADGLRGEQNETVVVPDYRGMGLAVRVKAQLIRELLAAEPSLAILDTYNAVDNHRMLAVNRRLGFRLLDTHGAWTLAL